MPFIKLPNFEVLVSGGKEKIYETPEVGKAWSCERRHRKPELSSGGQALWSTGFPH